MSQVQILHRPPMIAIIFLIFNLIFALFVFFLTIAFVTGAPFVPSTSKTSEVMITLSKLKKGMKVYDLGSGDGRLLVLAAKGGARAVGFEINPFLVLFCKIRYLFHPSRSKFTTQWKNFWSADIGDADVVFVYLLPWRMKKLAQFLNKQLKLGTLIVSNSFIFPDWPVIRQDTVNHVYVFRKT